MTDMTGVIYVKSPMKQRMNADLGSRQCQALGGLNIALLEGLLCLLLPYLLLVVHIIFVDFEVGVIANLGKPLGPCLAMLDKQMVDEPIMGVEPEVWMMFFHLLIVSKWRRTDVIGHTFLTMRPYSAG